MELSPIVLFVYNRPDHTKRTLEMLQKNELARDSELFIYSDAPKNDQNKDEVIKVRECIKPIKGFKKVKIIERDVNWGLANSIINGVTDIVNKYNKIIVLEDDLVTSPYFLRFMNDGLHFYQNDPRIMSISGYTLPPTILKFPKTYSYDIYLNYRNSSWGWGTWADKWNLVDWEIKDFNQFLHDPKQQEIFNRGGNDLSKMLISNKEGTIESWAIRFGYAHFKNNMYSVCPRFSYIDNIGHDGTGIHCPESTIFTTDTIKALQRTHFIENIEPNEIIMQNFRNFFSSKPSILSKIHSMYCILFRYKFYKLRKDC